MAIGFFPLKISVRLWGLTPAYVRQGLLRWVANKLPKHPKRATSWEGKKMAGVKSSEKRAKEKQLKVQYARSSDVIALRRSTLASSRSFRSQKTKNFVDLTRNDYELMAASFSTKQSELMARMTEIDSRP